MYLQRGQWVSWHLSKQFQWKVWPQRMVIVVVSSSSLFSLYSDVERRRFGTQDSLLFVAKTKLLARFFACSEVFIFYF